MKLYEVREKIEEYVKLKQIEEGERLNHVNEISKGTGISEKRVRDYLINKLSETNKRGRWTKAENEAIKKLYEKYNENKPKFYEKFFPSRSLLSIKNRLIAVIKSYDVPKNEIPSADVHKKPVTLKKRGI